MSDTIDYNDNSNLVNPNGDVVINNYNKATKFVDDNEQIVHDEDTCPSPTAIKEVEASARSKSFSSVNHKHTIFF